MKSSNPLVSVIIPIYNAESYIIETVESVLNQTYDNIEIILIDHASTDLSSVLICERFSHLEHVRIITCDFNAGGPAMPRNKGIDNANGSFIAFLDADDVWLSNKLEEQIALMLYSNVNFSCSHATLIDSSGQFFRANLFPASLPRKKNEVYGLKDIVVKNTIVTSSVVLRKDFLEKLRFDESLTVSFSEDYLLWMSLMNKDDCCFFHVQKDLVKYRCLSNSSSQTYGRYRMVIKSIYVISKFVIDNKREDLFFRASVAVFLKLINISFSGLLSRVLR